MTLPDYLNAQSSYELWRILRLNEGVLDDKQHELFENVGRSDYNDESDREELLATIIELYEADLIDPPWDDAFVLTLPAKAGYVY